MIFVSDGCRELLHVEPGQLLSGQVTYAGLVHPEDLPQLINRRDGSVFPAFMTTTLVRDGDGKPLGLLAQISSC